MVRLVDYTVNWKDTDKEDISISRLYIELVDY